MSHVVRFAIAIVMASSVVDPSVVSAADSGGAARWSEILGPARGQLPAPLEAVKWRSDLGNAMEQARRENRPLFVTLRCLPCKQCSAFDKNVLEGGEALDPLLKPTGGD